ncbi:MAG TPA: hypothetical protein PKD24_10555 [Pyrinomonadaceae bacterium]|nr:hypothetical protein [Pyrinomonadaceae bacterium]HMP65366.1 hypothetical protein [Pyrinomonadaceae bacterium]
MIHKIATDGDPQQSANDSDVFISYEGCDQVLSNKNLARRVKI